LPEADDEAQSVARTLEQINDCWINSTPNMLGSLVHDNVTMVLPGFSGRVTGKQAMIDGFADFCENAIVHSYRCLEPQIDVVGETAVASVSFAMVYERDAAKYRATGRDLWVFTKSHNQWLGVWRTMLDMSEEPYTE